MSSPEAIGTATAPKQATVAPATTQRPGRCHSHSEIRTSRTAPQSSGAAAGLTVAGTANAATSTTSATGAGADRSRRPNASTAAAISSTGIAAIRSQRELGSPPAKG